MTLNNESLLGVLLHQEKGHSARVNFFGADEEFLYSASGLELIVWEKGTFKKIATLGHPGWISSFTIDESRLYTGSENELTVWNKHNWSQIKIIKVDSRIRRIAVDNEFIYVNSGSSLSALNKQDFTVITSIPTPTRLYEKLVIDDEYIYSVLANEGEHIQVWEKNTWNEIKRFKAYDDHIACLAVDENNLYVSGSYKGVQVLVKSNWTELTFLESKSGRIHSIAIDDIRVYMASETAVHILMKEDWCEEHIISSDEIKISSVAIDDKFVYVGLKNNSINVYNKSNWTFLTEISGHMKKLTGLTLDDSFVCTSSNDGTVVVRSRKDWKEIAILSTESSIGSILLDNHFLYTFHGFAPSKIMMWSKQDWSKIMEFQGKDDWVFQLGLSDYVYGLSKNETVVIKRKDNLEDIFEIGSGWNWDGILEAVAVDDEYAFLGCRGGVVIWSKFFDVDVDILDIGRSTARSLAVDNDYIYVGVGSEIHIWKRRGRTEIATIEGLGTVVKGLYSGKEHLYSMPYIPSSVSHIVQVWSKKNWSECGRLDGHYYPIVRVFETDDCVYTIDESGRSILWNKTNWERFDDTTIDDTVHKLGGNLIGVLMLQHSKRVRCYIQGIIEGIAPYVSIDPECKSISIVEPWYIKNNPEQFNEMFECLSQGAF